MVIRAKNEARYIADTLSAIFDPAALAPRQVVVVDSITSLLSMGSIAEVTSMIIRLVDFLKMNGITAVMTALIPAAEGTETTGVNVSSLVDTWLTLQNTEIKGVRARALSIVKARGMGHSNQLHEFVMSKNGVELKTDAWSRKYA